MSSEEPDTSATPAIEYTILCVPNARTGAMEKLVTKVTEHVALGWQPVGGVAMTYVNENAGWSVAQAMVRFRVKID